MTKEQIEARWKAQAKELLVGKKIVDVGYLTSGEAEAMGWTKRPVVLTLDDGTYIFPSMDDEGNDGGALFSSNEGLPTIPVLS